MASEAISLVSPSTKIKATSTLHRNKAEFGPQHVLDGATETCWNSDQGTPQALTVTFVEASTPTHLTLTFQGGFVGTDCQVQVPSKEEATGWATVVTVHPVDSNAQQEFPLPPGIMSAVKKLRLNFQKSTDFYGRVTVYSLGIKGHVGESKDATGVHEEASEVAGGAGRS